MNVNTVNLSSISVRINLFVELGKVYFSIDSIRKTYVPCSENYLKQTEY